MMVEVHKNRWVRADIIQSVEAEEIGPKWHNVPEGTKAVITVCIPENLVRAYFDSLEAAEKKLLEILRHTGHFVTEDSDSKSSTARRLLPPSVEFPCMECNATENPGISGCGRPECPHDEIPF